MNKTNTQSSYNNRHAYQHYSIEDFDHFDCLKLSKGLYLTLLFILRGYIIWIMSITNMRDKVAIIEWFYPEPALFYLSLISGILGLYIVLIISLRRPDAANWVKSSWHYCRGLLIAALAFDLLVNWLGYFYWQLSSLPWLIGESIIAFYLLYFVLTSHKLRLNSNEFPEKLSHKN
jgi:hypothetical protein